MGNTNSADERPPGYENIKASLKAIANKMPLNSVQEFIQLMNSEEGGGFDREFNELPQCNEMTSVAELEVNKPKNRDNQVIPYDSTRVELRGCDDGDYINANYLYGYDFKRNKYIATQGPMSTTVADFWYMIWQEDVATIVMMAPTDECEVYWPTAIGETVTYGNNMITLDSQKGTVYWTSRFMTLNNQNMDRQLQLYQFTAWPNGDRPENIYSLLDLIHRVNVTDPGRSPIVVHCCNGIGRTGAFIALDYLITQSHKKGKVDVKSCVTLLSYQRSSLIQTTAQYAFLYEALSYYCKLGKATLTVSMYLQTYKKALSVQQMRQHQLLFEALLEIRAPMNLECDGLKSENISKNRDPNIIPDDRFRPILKTPSSKSTNYINAVSIYTFDSRDKIIVTQRPMKNTIEDFWTLVYDNSFDVIVLLDNKINYKEHPRYWPTVEAKSTEENPTSIVRGAQNYGKIEVITEDARKINSNSFHGTMKCSQNGKIRGPLDFYHFLDWPSYPTDWTPGQISELVDLFRRIEFMANRPKKILVHCLDGASKSGLFCALYIIMERVRAFQEVDIALACQMIVSRRANFISTLDEYNAMFAIVRKYLEKPF